MMVGLIPALCIRPSFSLGLGIIFRLQFSGHRLWHGGMASQRQFSDIWHWSMTSRAKHLGPLVPLKQERDVHRKYVAFWEPLSVSNNKSYDCF
ncbi:hypothetical protein DFJ43DRAFT_1077827 [Lentinula guzmanii]|uniref:Uncharacterized protein n=1 Tax=Lentinula guzmanii TaxID=2804957 RepID=A0AA38JQG7_9AGAR|nr:hypothetical protein DFJ43DRAFT_1077827 [Lentinula guzmanii]